MSEVINEPASNKTQLDTSFLLPLVKELNKYHLSIRDAAALILKASLEMVGASAGAIFLSDRHTNEFLTLADLRWPGFPSGLEDEVRTFIKQSTIPECDRVIRASDNNDTRYVGAMLMRKRVRLAIILVGTRAFDSFTYDHGDLLMTLAGMVADAFERLEIENEQEVLLETFEQLGSSPELPEVYRRIEVTVKELFKCDGVAIVERIIRADSEPILRTLYDSNPADSGVEIELSQGGLTWWAINNKDHMLFSGERDGDGNYIISSGKVKDIPVRPVYRNYIIEKSLLICPIEQGGESFGAITIYNIKNESKFDNQLDPQLLKKIGIQVAIAIKNAQEFQRARSHKSQSKILADLTGLVSSTESFEKVIKGTLKNAVKLVQGTSGFIALRTLHDNQLTANYVFNRDPNTVPIYDLSAEQSQLGIVGWVINYGHYYLTTDLQNDPHFARSHSGINSKIAVPLQPPNEEIIGVLSVDSHKKGAFNKNQAVMLQAVANQIALYIYNARFLNAVTLLAKPFLRVENFQSLYDEVLKRLIEIMGVQVASIHRIENDTLVTKARSKGFQEGVPRVIPKSGVISWRAILNRGPVAIENLQKKPELLHHQEYITKYKLVSAICVPILLGETPLGVINVYARRPHVFSRLETRLLELLAETLAVNINNVELIHAERTQKEELEKAYEVMSNNNRLMSIYEMANSFVHDARNTLNGISGSFLDLKYTVSEAIDKKYLSGKYQSEAEDAIHAISSELTNLSDYFSKLNNYARILETRMANESISKVIESVLDLMHLRIKKNKIKVKTSLQGDFVFVFDKGQIEQVISNLVLNAIQAMEKKSGNLYIGTEQVVRTIRGIEKDCIKIRISDDGSGIKLEHRQRIFDAFFTTKWGKGTGFGLTLCRKVIEENHNGLIDFESEWGRGTTFDIFLPLDLEEDTLG